ncbi:hypothetical protein ACFPM0_15695 [Pseudonocardia sulfidoxydans]|uniref:hypothetical protein n=1 Tax=Pseudonocardia sulfidoxydans TaxID=54011 RepID=UPI003620E54A
MCASVVPRWHVGAARVRLACVCWWVSLARWRGVGSAGVRVLVGVAGSLARRGFCWRACAGGCRWLVGAAWVLLACVSRWVPRWLVGAARVRLEPRALVGRRAACRCGVDRESCVLMRNGARWGCAVGPRRPARVLPGCDPHRRVGESRTVMITETGA